MEDILDRIATGTTTERDAVDVARIMAQHAALKLFVLEVAQFCTDPVYQVRAARMLGVPEMSAEQK